MIQLKQLKNINLYYIRKILIFIKIKKLKKLDKYNKFRMENIQAKATFQLLNIQDTIDDFSYEPFCLIAPLLKEKSKSKLSNRVLTTHSSEREIHRLQKINNKQILKEKLKKLLQKEKFSPKNQISSLKTSDNFQLSKVSQSFIKTAKINRNEQTNRFWDLKKHPLACMQRENTVMSSQKGLCGQTREAITISLFEQQSQQIRKLIKRRIQQKAGQKSQKYVLSHKIFENVKKIKCLLKQKNVFLQKKENSLVKLKTKKPSSKKLFINEILTSTINDKSLSKDKQNMHFKGFSAATTPNQLTKQKQNPYQSRKLKSILF